MSQSTPLRLRISSLLDALLGKRQSTAEERAASLSIYRVILVLGAALTVGFGIFYRQLGPEITDPMGVRAGLAGLALAIVGASYLSGWARRQMGRLYRGYIYLLIPWYTGLLVANQYAWSYGLGLIVLHAAAGLAFGVCLRRSRPLAWFLGFSTGLPLAGWWGVSSSEMPLFLLALSLGGLAILIYVVTRWRIRSVRELRTSRHRYERLARKWETLFEAASDPIFLVDVRETGGEYRFQYRRMNVDLEAFPGEVSKSVRGLSPQELFGKEAGAHAADRYRQCAEQKEVIEYEIHLPTANGMRWWHSKLTPIIEDGAVTRIMGIARDITDQKRRKRKLREQEQILEQIRQNVRDVIWMSTPGKEAMDFVSQSYEEVWGRPTDELIEQPTSFLDAIHPEDQDRVRSAVQAQQERPEDYEETYRVIRPDGETRWVRDRASGIYDEEGALIRVVGMATDITSQQRREEQLRLLDRLIQHDLRGDVTSAQGWAEVVARGTDPQKAASRIQAATRHMLEILDATDALQHALRSGQRMEHGPVELRPYIEQAVQTSERRFPEARITVAYSSSASAYVQANELLGSVFENLIANGIRHNDQKIPEVTVQVQQGSDRVRVTVADNGPGIPPSQRAAIFEKERRGLDSPGMGLGLYLVETLVGQYGGRVEVTDNEPRGARFIVELPRAETESE